MAEKVNIASLTIDVDDVIKESVRLQKEIDKTKKLQKELDTTTDEGAASWQKYDAQLKNTKKSLRDNQQFVSALDAANEDLNQTMSVQNKSTQELRDSRSQLNKISKNIVGNTEEEIELREQLNVAIDEQTEALREQGSEFNAGKDKIGEYTQGINASDLSLQSFITQSQDAGGATKLVSGGLKGAIKSMWGFTKATLAFLATPVGLVLAVIAGAFLLIRNAMNRSEESTMKVKKAFAAFSGIIKGVMKVLEPLGVFLIDYLVWSLDMVTKAVFAVVDAFVWLTDKIGLDGISKQVKEFKEEIEESTEAAQKLVEAELALTKAQRIARKVQLEFLKDAEEFRQIRDDTTKSIKERIKANEDLGASLKKQAKEEAAILQKALDLANLRIQLEGETEDALNARAAAETEIADLEERITGQTSEQLVNRVALMKEGADAVRAIKDQEEKESEEAAKKQIELDKQVAEAAIESARFELNDYIRKNKSKLDSDKALTNEAVQEETKRLEALAEQRREFEATRLEEGAINEAEYNDTINQINDENQIAIDEVKAEREEANKEKQAIDAENYLIFLEQQTNNELENQTRRLEAEMKAELDAAEKTGANKALIEAKYDQRQKVLDAATTDSQIAGFGQVFDSYASVLGEQTAAGKAAAIASTVISTYQGAQQAFTSLSGIPIVGTALGIAAAGAAVIAGVKNIQKITSTPTTFSKGDILKGKSHARGGIPFALGGQLGFEAEHGEALINKRSTAMFRPLLSSINEAGGGKKFASGDILGTSSGPSSISIIDYDLLASRISQANESLPVPVVSVEEFNSVDSNVEFVENLASA